MPDSPRVVVVAPDTDLEFARAGVDAVVNCGLPVSLISGEVTLARLIEWDWRGKPGGVLYIANAALDAALDYAVPITDAALTVENLTPFIREGQFAAVYINALAAERLAYQLVNECGVIVISMLGSAPSASSYQTSVRFFRNLKDSGGDFWEAFQRAKPGHNRSFIFLEPDIMNHIQRPPGPNAGGGTLEDLRSAVSNINRALLGDDFTPGGLVGQIRRLQAAVDAFAQVDREHQTNNERRWRELEDSLGGRIDALAQQVDHLQGEIQQMRGRRFAATERVLVWVMAAGLPLIVALAAYVAAMAGHIPGWLGM